jgi:Na+-transporting methylmalonyl-CoA/oxaloacetate decarboxylase gamma subunit
MMFRKIALVLALLFTLLVVMSSMAAAAPQTLTGVVTENMCNKKHTMMPGKPDSECIRACVKAGSKYALLVSRRSSY